MEWEVSNTKKIELRKKKEKDMEREEETLLEK